MANTQAEPPAFYVPINLDPRIVAKGQRQYAACFLSLLHWKWLCWQADDSGWIPLKHAYITRIIPDKVWPTLRERLWGKRVILWSGFWTPGKQAQRYQIAPEYRQTKRIECTNDALARRIHEVYATETVPLLPVHRWLQEKLALLEFDLALAEKIITTMEPDTDSTMPIAEYRQMLAEMCKRIVNEDYWFMCDRFGRVHTPITSLAKELRKCLRVDGQPLVGLDLANSQPLVAGLIARQFYHSRMKAMRFRSRTFQQDGNPYHRRHLEGSETNRPDLNRYLEVCEAGQLYESLMQADDDRDRIKRRFLTAMYGKNHWRDPLKDQLTQLHPSVAGMLTSLKRHNYRHAAHVLQNAEAVIFIHTIADRIRQERPELPVYTIHDSILTVPPAIGYVREVILDVFDRLGVHPFLRMEDEA